MNTTSDFDFHLFKSGDFAFFTKELVQKFKFLRREAGRIWRLLRPERDLRLWEQQQQ